MSFMSPWTHYLDSFLRRQLQWVFFFSTAASCCWRAGTLVNADVSRVTNDIERSTRRNGSLALFRHPDAEHQEGSWPWCVALPRASRSRLLCPRSFARRETIFCSSCRRPETSTFRLLLHGDCGSWSVGCLSLSDESCLAGSVHSLTGELGCPECDFHPSMLSRKPWVGLTSRVCCSELLPRVSASWRMKSYSSQQKPIHIRSPTCAYLASCGNERTSIG